jgi:hypothetical protein
VSDRVWRGVNGGCLRAGVQLGSVLALFLVCFGRVATKKSIGTIFFRVWAGRIVGGTGSSWSPALSSGALSRCCSPICYSSLGVSIEPPAPRICR